MWICGCRIKWCINEDSEDAEDSEDSEDVNDVKDLREMVEWSDGRREFVQGTTNDQRQTKNPYEG